MGGHPHYGGTPTLWGVPTLWGDTHTMGGHTHYGGHLFRKSLRYENKNLIPFTKDDTLVCGHRHEPAERHYCVCSTDEKYIFKKVSTQDDLWIKTLNKCNSVINQIRMLSRLSLKHMDTFKEPYE